LSQFEYVTVFVSILLALAVADLLGGLGRLIRERDHVRVYWVHVAWMFLAILAVTQSWWAIWNIRTHEFANFLEFVALVLPRFNVVLVAFLLSPPISTDQSFDLRAYYFLHIRWVVLLFAAALLGVAVSSTAFGVEEPFTVLNGIRVTVVGNLVFLGFSENPRIHAASVFLIGGLFALAIAVVFLQRT